jgi:hypothetical protein
MNQSNCHSHSGHIERINSAENKMGDIKFLVQILIAIVVAINSGFFAMLWNMNTTLSGMNGKIATYDKIFESKLDIKEKLK